MKVGQIWPGWRMKGRLPLVHDYKIRVVHLSLFQSQVWYNSVVQFNQIFTYLNQKTILTDFQLGCGYIMTKYFTVR